MSLVVVATLGLGLLSVAPSANAAVFGETLTIDANTDTTTVGDSASAVMTHVASSTTAANSSIQAMESTTVSYTCSAPTGASCPALQYWQTPSADTANVENKPGYTAGENLYWSTNWSDTLVSSTGTMRSVANVKAVNFSTAGTYTYTFYTKDKTNTVTSLVPFTWTITVSAATTTIGSALSNLYVSSDTLGYTAETNRKNFRASSDSAVVVDRGTAATPVAVATAFAVVKNSNGDTAVATAVAAKNTASATPVRDTLTVTVSGPGFVSSAISTTRAKAATVNSYNGGTLYTGTNSTATGESLTVWSDGTAGVSTITLSNSVGAVIGSFTVTFTGAPASAASSWLTDTVVPLTGQNDSVVAIVKDSAGTVLKSGTVYLYSSDTSIAGDVPTSFPNPKTSTHACTIDALSLIHI